ncbi:uncharacterized protein N7515_001663, partial [Penicillium bovifimosum]
SHGPEQQSHKVHPRIRRPEADSHLIDDEAGLQCVFNHSMGYIVGKVLKGHICGVQVPWKQSFQTPDSSLMTKDAWLRVVGELKFLGWTKIGSGMRMSMMMNPRYAICLSSPSSYYMKDLNCMYGFMSNYCGTIFLRREFIEDRRLIDYSPIARADTSYDGPGRSPGYTSCINQAMFPCRCGSSTDARACLQYNTKARMGCGNEISAFNFSKQLSLIFHLYALFTSLSSQVFFVSYS